MFGWSLPTIIIIGLIVFIIFGAGKLPEIGSGMGKALKNFKNSLAGKDEIDVTPAGKHEEDSSIRQSRKKIPSGTASSAGAAKKRKTGQTSAQRQKRSSKKA